MKKNLRRKIHAFLRSEEGKVSVKAPLALSVMSGSFLLAEIMFTSSVSAGGYCDPDCSNCLIWCTESESGITCTGICTDS